MPKAGSRVSVPGMSGLRPVAHDDQAFAEPELLGHHDGAVDLDLVGLRRHLHAVGDFDVGDHEAVLLGELAPHLGDAVGEFALRGQQPRGELLAHDDLDLGRAQEFLDGILGLGRGGVVRHLGGGRDLGRLGGGDAARQHGADRHHGAPEQREGEEGEPRHQRQHEHHQRGDEEGAREVHELVQHRLFGRAARAALGDQQRRAERHDQGGDLRHEAVADRQLGEHVRRLAERHAVARDADDDAAEDIDGQDDQARHGVAADEFRGAVHGAEEGALLLELAAAALGLLVVDQAGREVGVDRHLLAGDGVEREARADFGDARRALGDDHEIDGQQDGEDDEADDEIAAHHEPREAADDEAGGVRPLGAVRTGSGASWRC